jgi:hypothetical protein
MPITLISNPVRTTVASKSVPADWPEFHLDAARDGNQEADTLLSKANASSLVPVSGPGFTTTGAAMSSPAVYQGILYYAANMPVTSGTRTLHISTMYAVNARTGNIVWSKNFPHCPNVTKSQYVFSSPAVTTGLVNGVATQEVFIGWGPMKSNMGCLYDFTGMMSHPQAIHNIVYLLLIFVVMLSGVHLPKGRSW